MSKTHELKTLWPFWEAVADGTKTFELRKNDRDFQTGDRLRLVRTVPGTPDIEKQVIEKTVTYVLSGWGLKNGFVALGLSSDIPCTKGPPTQKRCPRN